MPAVNTLPEARLPDRRPEAHRPACRCCARPPAPRAARAWPATASTGLCALLLWALVPQPAAAQPAAPAAAVPAAQAVPGVSEALAAEVQRLAREAATIVWGGTAQPPRIEVRLGRLDPRLKLAPCQRIEPYLPAGMRPLGRSRVGLRCTQGTTAWNVTLPIEVQVWAPSLAAATALPAGTVLEARHLVTTEVDLAERADPAIAAAAAVLGRTLVRGLASGEALRRGDLKTRQYFNAGDTVRIVAVGAGYAVSSEGQAMGPGLEGQSARVRTDGGRIVTGVATGERRVELAL